MVQTSTDEVEKSAGLTIHLRELVREYLTAPLFMVHMDIGSRWGNGRMGWII